MPIHATTLASCYHGRGRVLDLLTRKLMVHHGVYFKDIRQLRYHSDGQQAQMHNIRNIGIIAHVDAGKTTTTEKMLYHAGLKHAPGDVKSGNTVTDFLPMEVERQITIQSAAITMMWPPKDSCVGSEPPKIINLIDTPGHRDFSFEVIRSMPEIDGAVVILDATRGVETNTEKVWLLTREHRVPVLCYLNKHDQEGASVKKCVREIAARLGATPLICQIPWWKKDKFVGHVDVIKEVGMKYTTAGRQSLYGKHTLPEEVKTEVARARLRLIEELADRDEELAEEYLEHESAISNNSIKKAIRRIIMDGRGKVVPVFCGASAPNIGVQPMLDAINDYLPDPAERPGLVVTTGTSERKLSEILEEQSKQKGFNPHRPTVLGVAHVFKVVDDERRGMLSFVRVHYGTLGQGELWNTREQKMERPSNILQISGGNTFEIQSIAAGHIGALTGLKEAKTGDTLVLFGSRRPPEDVKLMQIRRPEVPPAVAFLSAYPVGRSNEVRLEETLAKLSRVDPSLRYRREDKIGGFIISGMGKLHFEVIVDRLRNFYRFTRQDLTFGDVEVEYYETVLGYPQPHRAVWDRELAGKPGKAACTATIAPLVRKDAGSPTGASGISKVVKTGGNVLVLTITNCPTKDQEQRGQSFEPEAVLVQLMNGALAALSRGPRHFLPIRDCHVEVMLDYQTDFTLHLSTPGHVQNAALQAIATVLTSAHNNGLVGILEPFMAVRISSPEAKASAVQHDLVSKRDGQVLEVYTKDDGAATLTDGDGLIDLDGLYAPPDPFDSVTSLRDKGASGAMRTAEIVGKAPLREMLEYDAHLRELTGGKNNLWMNPVPDTYEVVKGPRLKALEEGY